MTKEEEIEVNKEINRLMKWKKIDLVYLILNYKKKSYDLAKKAMRSIQNDR